MNRLIMALLFGYFLVMLQSCNKDDMIDSSHITDFRWEVSTILLSESVDLDKDGVFSTNLLEELPCYKDSFYFGIDGKVYLTKHTMALMYHSNDPEKCYVFQDCENEGVLAVLTIGSYEMINESKIILKTTSFQPTFPSVEFTLELIDEKLIRLSSIYLPIDYDETHECYSTVQLSAKYEFEKYYFY